MYTDVHCLPYLTWSDFSSFNKLVPFAKHLNVQINSVQAEIHFIRPAHIQLIL